MLGLFKQNPLLLTVDQQLADNVDGVSLLAFSKEKPLVLIADQQLPDNIGCIMCKSS